MAVIGIIETGAGNITSLIAAIQRIGHTAQRLSHPDVTGIDQLVLPGQGRFGPVMARLRENHWDQLLRQWFVANKPLFGICVGMQILFEHSAENPDCTGLGFLSGTIEKLQSPKQPMIGWSTVQFLPHQNRISADAYFVNSYVLPESVAAIAYAQYGQRFVAAITKGATVACQFHPEKSGAYGDYLLKQWLLGSEQMS